MAIETGDKLGPYEILALLGSGGMGEVYKARDARLERTVAIKVLPEHLADDPERRARLEREAKAVSQLNHVHICTLHDIGNQNGIVFLVMEYLEGETLADRLTRGALSLEEALRYAGQIADALDVAHRHGVVHRDLKPANIMITKAGIKLMDFGLAKVESAPVEAGSAVPTAEKPLTREGAVMGTVPYMAPEQLEGKTVDARTDIFAYGALVYEMVTGRRAFEGESQASLIAAIMGTDPTTFKESLPLTPPMLGAVVSKALAKSPDERWQSMRDVRIVLDLDAQPGAATTPVPRRRSYGWLAWTGALVLAIATTWFVRRPPSPEVVRLGVSLPEGEDLRYDGIPAFDISADGRRLAFATVPSTGTFAALYVRDTGRFEPRIVLGIDNATQPAFSPDGRSIAIAVPSPTVIQKISLDEGIVTTLCEAPSNVRGLAWSESGEIFFGTDASGVWRVSADGGVPERVTSHGAGDTMHSLPDPLPGGKGLLFTSTRSNTSRVALVTPGMQEYRVLFEGYGATYVSSGHIVYGQTDSLEIFAVPFDLDALEVPGPAVRIEDGVALFVGEPMFRVSDAGIVYSSGSRPVSSVVWVDREGHFETIQTVDSRYHTLDLSADATSCVVDEAASAARSVWVYDLDRGTRVLASTGSGLHLPRFTPDGGSITYNAHDGNVYLKSSDGTGDARTLVAKEHATWAVSWSPDGTLLALTESHPETGRDIWILPPEGDPYPFVVTPANENAATFSPDGAWIAYQSDESGRAEIYVQPFPGPGTRILISTNGGKEPLWAPSGRELFYRQGTALMAVPVGIGSSFQAGVPALLFDGPFQADAAGHTSYDVSPDGQKFLMIRNESTGRVELRVVLNLAKELAARVPR